MSLSQLSITFMNDPAHDDRTMSKMSIYGSVKTIRDGSANERR